MSRLDTLIDRLIVESERQVLWARKFEKKRYLFDEIKNLIARSENEYYVGIKGLRGVGKTVLMLQLMRDIERSIYFSADSLLAREFSIYEIVRGLIKRDFKTIFIDEIHSRPRWDVDLKSLYDEHHDVMIVFTGSSAMDITKTGADLSRRVVMKELRIVSFREYLNIRRGLDIPPLSFEVILREKERLTRQYALCYDFFDEYTRYGGVLYPKEVFHEELDNALRKVVVHDLIALREINVEYDYNASRLLHLVAHSPPFEVNYSSLSRDLGVTKPMAIKMVNELATAGLLIPIFPCQNRDRNIRKEPKIYLTIPIREYLAGETDITGVLREEFFVNHVRDVCYVKGERGEKTPDFRCGDKTIEIGGAKKKGYQGADYIAVDGLSMDGNKIPLFLFGFAY
ncbi:MAG: AAA family ATPase [Candidatus Korarchaeota archaeon]